MDVNELRRKQKANALIDDLYQYEDDMLSTKDINHLKKTLGASYGHADIHYAAQSEVDIMNRMLSDNKTIDGTFTSDKHQWEAIRSIIEFNNEHIIKDTGELIYDQKAVYSLTNLGSFDDEPLGHGFIKLNGFYNKFESENICIVLKRHDQCKYGFYLHTAYPGEQFVKTRDEKDIGKKVQKLADNLKITKGDFSDIMKQTDEYKKASPIKKTYLEYIANSNNQYRLHMSAGNQKNGYQDTLSLTKRNEDGSTYRTYITETEIRTTKFDKDNKPMGSPLAKYSLKNRLNLDTDDAKKAFAKIEPSYTKTIVQLQNRLTKLASKQKVRELPHIDKSNDVQTKSFNL